MSVQKPSTQRRSPASVEPGRFKYTRPENADDVAALIKKYDVEIVDLRFTDLPGLWQHFSITLPEVGPGLFEDGIGFDGSSIRGFQEIHESDMLLKPDPTTAFIDPFCEVPTLALICDVVDPMSASALLAGSALHGAQGRRVPGGHRRRGHLLLRSRARVLHLRLDSLRARTRIPATITSSPPRASGTPDATKERSAAAISVTSHATRKAIFPFRRTTRCRTSARKSCSL